MQRRVKLLLRYLLDISVHHYQAEIWDESIHIHRQRTRLNTDVIYRGEIECRYLVSVIELIDGRERCYGETDKSYNNVQ